AIVKPWGEPPRREAAASTASVADRSSLAAAVPEPGLDASSGPLAAVLTGLAGDLPTLPPGAVGCGTPEGWRLVTLGQLLGLPVQSDSLVEPLAGAVGPSDPRIPTLPAGEAPVSAVGACRPAADPGVADDRTDRPPVLVSAAWLLEPTGPRPVSLALVGLRSSTSAEVQLYAPTLATSGWWPGRYVMELATADLPVPSWVAFEVSPAPPAQAP
ncbi:MAG TPA: hypothetical protein VEY67_07395, partial [Candidatus Dormibacteraeota bacterium]|nr:hypothetical protein [Candidatus Dormibacteraeota bacterium]